MVPRLVDRHQNLIAIPQPSPVNLSEDPHSVMDGILIASCGTSERRGRYLAVLSALSPSR